MLRGTSIFMATRKCTTESCLLCSHQQGRLFFTGSFSQLINQFRRRGGVVRDQYNLPPIAYQVTCLIIRTKFCNIFPEIGQNRVDAPPIKGNPDSTNISNIEKYCVVGKGGLRWPRNVRRPSTPQRCWRRQKTISFAQYPCTSKETVPNILKTAPKEEIKTTLLNLHFFLLLLKCDKMTF